MRRATSILFFLIGGWFLTGQLCAAFIEVSPGVEDNLLVIGLFGALAALPLLIGAWASPGERWRELGLTMLIAVGIVVICGLTMLLMLLDPAIAKYMPPAPDLQFAPAAGIANALLLGALGWFLWGLRQA